MALTHWSCGQRHLRQGRRAGDGRASWLSFTSYAAAVRDRRTIPVSRLGIRGAPPALVTYPASRTITTKPDQTVDAKKCPPRFARRWPILIWARLDAPIAHSATACKPREAPRSASWGTEGAQEGARPIGYAEVVPSHLGRRSFGMELAGPVSTRFLEHD